MEIVSRLRNLAKLIGSNLANEAADHIEDLDGEPHTGPAVDYLFHVVRKIKLVARTALERIDRD